MLPDLGNPEEDGLPELHMGDMEGDILRRRKDTVGSNIPIFIVDCRFFWIDWFDCRYN